MKPRRVLIAAGILLMSFSAYAQETPEKEAPPHDYSRPTLLYIFNEEEQPKTKPDLVLEYSTPNWTFRFIPFLAPIVTNRNIGTALLMPTVDPFALLNLDYPQTAETYPDRGPQNRYRRRMLNLVSAANRADRERRLGGGS
jgi:hypothetical protein